MAVGVIRLAALVWAGLATSAFAQAKPEAAPPAAAAKAPRPLEQFAALPLLERPRISPNGKLIATRIASAGKQYFAIAPLDGKPPRLISTGDTDLNWWRWVNDEWLVVGIGEQQSVPGTDGMYVRRAVSINATNKKMVAISGRDAAQSADDILWVARDGTPRVLLARQKSIYTSDAGFWPEVVEVDVSTGRSKLAMAPRDGVLSWVADGSGTVRMGIGRSDDGRQMRVLYRDRAGESLRQIVRPTKKIDGIVVPAMFLPEPGKAIAVAEDEGGFDSLFEFDINELKLGKRLYASKGFDIAGFTSNAQDNAITSVSYLEDAQRREWIDPDLAALQGEVSKLVRGGTARVTDFTPDHKRAVVFVGATNSPGAYYIYDRAAQEMLPLGKINDDIGMARLNPVSTIRYKARDGLEIAAVLTLPRLKPARNLPLIVLPHGGPFARDSEEWDWWTQALAERGYAVVQPNYRGSSGYGDAHAKKGAGQWGLAMQDDLIDAIGELGKRGIADPKRVCIVGASYGGYAAMRATQRDAAHYRCAVSYAGVSDLGRMKSYDSRFLSSGVRADWLKLQATDFREVSPLTTPARTAIPLLLVHGRKDTVVPVSQSRAMAGRLRGAGKPVTFIEQPLGDHHFSRGEDRLEFLKALQAFLDQHNPA